MSRSPALPTPLHADIAPVTSLLPLVDDVLARFERQAVVLPNASTDSPLADDAHGPELSTLLATCKALKASVAALPGLTLSIDEQEQLLAALKDVTARKRQILAKYNASAGTS